jgi:hypothetical protein
MFLLLAFLVAVGPGRAACRAAHRGAGAFGGLAHSGYTTGLEDNRTAFFKHGSN